MNRRSLVFALLALLGSSSACKKPGAKQTARTLAAPAQSAASARRAASVGSRQGVGDGAFDLVVTDSGAALIWANAHERGLSLSLFDELGAERRSEPAFDEGAGAGDNATDARIAEVSAVTRGSELAIAWLEQRGSDARTRAVIRSTTDSGSAPRVLEIGPVFPPISRPRGNIALTRANDRFLLLARGEKEDCVDPTERDCVGFGFHRLEGTSAARQNLPLSVPLPCEQNSVSFAVAGSRWYYGVCSRATGKPITTLFTIQTDPEYARADRILEGCLPLGALAQGSDLLVVGDCSGERRGARMHSGNAEASELGVNRIDAICDAGRPILHQLGQNGLELPLDGPRDRLEAFLPQNLAPPNARAVWTGQRLLVASPAHGKIILKSYQCDSTMLREAPLAAKP
ncbi:MAG TPA: hypothetical protein VHV51_02850 [Polyangiaceae bacterium]|jgi:hypothetical protein|nr:hypothetical protein [Polyangiaceae bacterium]